MRSFPASLQRGYRLLCATQCFTQLSLPLSWRLRVSTAAQARLRICETARLRGPLSTFSMLDSNFCPGDVEELPEGTREYNPSIMRIRPSGQPQEEEEEEPRQTGEVTDVAPPQTQGTTHAHLEQYRNRELRLPLRSNLDSRFAGVGN